MNFSNLGNSIKYNRELLNLTQESLAEMINVSPHYIYELERGLKLPSLKILIALSETLHTGIDNLLSIQPQIADTTDDELNLLINKLNAEQRNNLSKILKPLLPHLKL